MTEDQQRQLAWELQQMANRAEADRRLQERLAQQQARKGK